MKLHYVSPINELNAALSLCMIFKICMQCTLNSIVENLMQLISALNILLNMYLNLLMGKGRIAITRHGAQSDLHFHKAVLSERHFDVPINKRRTWRNKFNKCVFCNSGSTPKSNQRN